jgi:flagellar protein FlbD
MIKLTRLNGKEFFVNPHMMEFIEETPDTVITMLSEKKFIVKESIDDIKKLVTEYRKKLGNWGNDQSL